MSNPTDEALVLACTRMLTEKLSSMEHAPLVQWLALSEHLGGMLCMCVQSGRLTEDQVREILTQMAEHAGIQTPAQPSGH